MMPPIATAPRPMPRPITLPDTVPDDVPPGGSGLGAGVAGCAKEVNEVEHSSAQAKAALENSLRISDTPKKM